MSGAKPFRLPPCTPTPRSDILPPTCSAIDIFLKRAKSHLRDAQAIFSSHQAEMALLERLYYKGKNQHRMSLFWQRVCEMRRYGRRLQDMNVTGMMENNRAMFYGLQAPVNSKQLKGAWTHCPTASSLHYILRRLELSFQLLDKVRISTQSSHPLSDVPQSRSRLQDIYRFVDLHNMTLH
ncbi:uncharacterized protein STEHIDRAFT_50373 [Stereum hirsutum FP-91666 SS1]|uniref:uncharacterized protein n=1 Tax=Stereum hirsutum (strain FP-91666) TaxID=721885 RepID=UPI000440C9AA|nr:uncharacterized protein STEHIDRAFT_50373 [Stereum hirsutum FP-91666 SS1]EIM89896.1 hypothetical protein STEHIDRAFT_50373 [Stereum hirsutum FP-91666 SS1]